MPDSAGARVEFTDTLIEDPTQVLTPTSPSDIYYYDERHPPVSPDAINPNLSFLPEPDVDETLFTDAEMWARDNPQRVPEPLVHPHKAPSSIGSIRPPVDNLNPSLSELSKSMIVVEAAALFDPLLTLREGGQVSVNDTYKIEQLKTNVKLLFQTVRPFEYCETLRDAVHLVAFADEIPVKDREGNTHKVSSIRFMDLLEKGNLENLSVDLKIDLERLRRNSSEEGMQE